MELLNVNFDTYETILESIDTVAEKIVNNFCLKINNAFYKIIDFEFYIFSDKFPDPHTYKNDLQLQNGKFYVHASGVDITFGDGTNHGGILLRSIVKLSEKIEDDNGFMEKQFDGPQIVATEIFSNINSLIGLERNEISLIDIRTQNQKFNFTAAKKVKTKRVGLTPKPNDSKDIYLNLPLRVVAIFPKFPNFKQTIKGIEKILREQFEAGCISEKDIIEILGYKKKFQ
jgi:hypothetical protein